MHLYSCVHVVNPISVLCHNPGPILVTPEESPPSFVECSKKNTQKARCKPKRAKICMQVNETEVTSLQLLSLLLILRPQLRRYEPSEIAHEHLLTSTQRLDPIRRPEDLKPKRPENPEAFVSYLMSQVAKMCFWNEGCPSIKLQFLVEEMRLASLS